MHPELPYTRQVQAHAGERYRTCGSLSQRRCANAIASICWCDDWYILESISSLSNSVNFSPNLNSSQMSGNNEYDLPAPFGRWNRRRPWPPTGLKHTFCIAAQPMQPQRPDRCCHPIFPLRFWCARCAMLPTWDNSTAAVPILYK